ncbi:FAD-dependent oxidoreductase, partial [Chloroflexota bacterium]
GLRTPEFCEKVIAEGMADFVALGRQLLADPQWPNKVYNNRLDDIRECTSCLECLGILSGRVGDTRCAINVALGREREFGEIKTAKLKRRILVVGSGPGGMEAARIAAIRGHTVTLYEKKTVIGGQLLLAAKPPGKEKLLRFRDYQVNQLRKLAVPIKLGVEVTSKLINETKPDVVIVATGAKPVDAPMPVANDSNVVHAWTVLEDKMKIKRQRVVVIGGGMIGAETAEYLAGHANSVTIIEILKRIADDMEMFNRKGLLDALYEKNVTFLTEHQAMEIVRLGVVVMDKRSGARELIEANQVVLATGAMPDKSLVQALQDRISQLYSIGDCKQPRNIMSAVYEGAFVAMQI